MAEAGQADGRVPLGAGVAAEGLPAAEEAIDAYGLAVAWETDTDGAVVGGDDGRAGGLPVAARPELVGVWGARSIGYVEPIIGFAADEDDAPKGGVAADAAAGLGNANVPWLTLPAERSGLRLGKARATVATPPRAC